MARPPFRILDFLGFSGRLVGRALWLVLLALKNWSTFTGGITSTLLICGISFSLYAWYEQHVLWWVPAGIFLALFIYGLLRASYEIETEKRALADRIETDEQRRRIGARLRQLHKQGKELQEEMASSGRSIPVSESINRFEEWRQSTVGYLAENVSEGKAQYVDGVTNLGAAMPMGVPPALQDTWLHLDQCLERLAEVMKEY